MIKFSLVSKHTDIRNLINLILIISTALIALLMFSACSNNDDESIFVIRNNQNCINSSIEGDQTITVGNSTREYILYVPTSYDCNEPAPLVINFHGFGGSASDFSKTVGEFYDLNSVADENGFLVAYPQGLQRAKEGTEWDPGDNGIEDINENDIFFTRRLILDIILEFRIDLSRIYAVGYSNGGMMAYGLACHASDMIAASGIMSGIMLESECDQSEQTPIIHFHGIEDKVLPLNGNQFFQPVSDVIDFWLNHNNISSESLVSTELNDSNVIKDEYESTSNNTSVVLFTIKQEHNKPGGHVWFSDDIDGISPNQILWDFLSSYRLDD